MFFESLERSHSTLGDLSERLKELLSNPGDALLMLHLTCDQGTAGSNEIIIICF